MSDEWTGMQKEIKALEHVFFLFFFSKMFHEQVHLEEGSGMKRVIKALEHVFFCFFPKNL